MDRQIGSAAESLAATTLAELDALIASIQDKPPSPADGWFDVYDIAKRMDVSPESARTACKNAWKAGKLERVIHKGKAYYHNNDGGSDNDAVTTD